MRFMKLNINKILYLIPAFVLALAGCNKQPVLHELNAPADQMKITPSATELVLQRVNAASEAVTFSWGDAADRGEDTKLTYYFRLYQTVNKDNQSELIRLDEGARSISFTTTQLNEIIASWGVLPGENVSVTAQVIAKVSVSYTFMKPEVSTTEISVVGYNPANIMYIIFGEGDNMRAYKMASNVADERQFSWVGQLPENAEYFFSYETTPGAPGYFSDGNGGAVYSENGQGTKFKTESGKITYEMSFFAGDTPKAEPKVTPYHIYVFTKINGQETKTQVAFKEFDWFLLNVNLPGGEMPAGSKLWASFNEDGSDPFTFDGDGIKKISDGSQASDITKIRHESTHVAMSICPNRGMFIVRDVFLKSDHIYPVGDVISNVTNDWDQGLSFNFFQGYGFLAQHDAEAPEIFSVVLDWKPCTREGFKLLTQASNWDNCYHPSVHQSDPVNQWQGIRVGGGGDDKWRPNVTGTYKLECDFHNMRLRMIPS